MCPNNVLRKMIKAVFYNLDRYLRRNEPRYSEPHAIGVYSPIGNRKSSANNIIYNSYGGPDMPTVCKYFWKKQHEEMALYRICLADIW